MPLMVQTAQNGNLRKLGRDKKSLHWHRRELTSVCRLSIAAGAEN